MKNPEVRIKFSELLYWGESQELYKAWQPKSKRQPIISFADCLKKEKQYRKAWAKNQNKILSGMQKALGLEFYRPVIDVALAPIFTPMSDPLIMNFRHEPDHFTDVLTHELFHVLLTDNKFISNRNQDTDLWERWQKIFGSKHSWSTLVHIPVHAGCKYIFIDVLRQPDRVQRDIDDIKSWTSEYKEGYLKSWEYVETNDYRKILADLKQMYSELKPE
ncbi:MAG TPA: hypothetical protein VI336_01050 [Candidatus Saccharimonadales bacterium]|nr:hypothetical protein [Candidatus Saccharimonadales bacterium]